MSYQITKDGNTHTFEDKDEWEDMQQLLDENDVDYEATANGTSNESQEERPKTHETNESPQNANAGVSSEYEYLTKHMGVPEVFITQLKGGSYHVDKTGYYHLADQQGISVTVKPLDPSFENDTERSTWLGIAIDANEREYSNVGSAHLAGENMSGAEYNLDELAATRAACRVLSMATGIGSTATEEMPNE